MKQQNKPGYVLVLSLMMIALIVVLVSTLADRGSVHVRYLKTMIDREKAKELAFSGVQIAMSQLARSQDSKEKKEQAPEQPGQKKEPAKKDETDPKQELLSLLPLLNKWQIFDLKKKNDGVTGQIKVCLSSEDGKLNLSRFFDFSSSVTGKDPSSSFAKATEDRSPREGLSDSDKKLLKEVFETIQKTIGGKKLLEPFEKFLKARKTRLQDLTELLEIPEFEIFKDRVFYDPSAPAEKDETGKLKQNVYLQDLFTLWSLQKELDPWMLSHSQKVLFGLKSKDKLDVKKLEEVLKNFSGTMQFPKGWDQMVAPLYGVKFDRLPQQMRAALGTKFEPSVFSVLSYGTVGGVTQKLLIILERKKSTSKDSSGKDVTSFEFSAKKFYWL